MFKDILVPVNTSDKMTWEKPLEAAIYLARSCGARLHVMTVVPSFDYAAVESFFPPDFEQKARVRTDKELHDFVAKHVPDDIPSQTIVAVGSVYEEILKSVDETGSDLVIMTRRGGNRRHFGLLGSNTDRVVQQSKTAVLVLE
jgi:nucleotide-binding universal stress UspA family protein